MEEKKFIDDLKHTVVSLIEVDQECIVLENFFSMQSKDRVIARIDEVTGALMKLREKIKALTKESYISKQ